jgi:hypothetical protein
MPRNAERADEQGERHSDCDDPDPQNHRSIERQSRTRSGSNARKDRRMIQHHARLATRAYRMTTDSDEGRSNRRRGERSQDRHVIPKLVAISKIPAGISSISWIAPRTVRKKPNTVYTPITHARKQANNARFLRDGRLFFDIRASFLST